MTKKFIKWVPVVTGCLKKDDKVLVGLRPQYKSLPLVWEFPGGKVENGEQPVAALQRELYEELDIHADVGKLLFVNTYNLDSTNILLMFYEVLSWEGCPNPKHHKDLKWVTKEELADLKIPESNRKFLDKILTEVFN